MKQKKKHPILWALAIIIIVFFVLPNMTGKTVVTDGYDCPAIEESVIYSDDSVAVKANRLEYNASWDTYVVNLSIHNSSPSEIGYSINYVDVNGYTIDALAYGDIYSGMDSDVELGFSHKDVKTAGIEKIMDIKFNIEFTDNSTKNTICNVAVDLKTSENGSYLENYDFIGQEVFNNGSIRILAAPNKNATAKAPLLLYIENNNDTPAQVSYHDMAYNSTMVTEMQSGPYILPHSHRIEEMKIFFFGEEPKIESLDSVTLKISVLPYRSSGGFSTGDIIYSEQFTINMK